MGFRAVGALRFRVFRALGCRVLGLQGLKFEGFVFQVCRVVGIWARLMQLLHPRACVARTYTCIGAPEP